MAVKILTVGGGSGGHVTPVVAVINELKRADPQAEIRFWCDRSFFSTAKSILSHAHADVQLSSIYSGKIRRYHGVSLLRQISDVPTLLQNIRDVLFVGIGVVQSTAKLITWRPDVIFTKGGYVCLPVGVAARMLNIPIVIHDSDAHPGLANRIIAPWARYIATGAPLDHYPYPLKKSKYVGIPIDERFKLVDDNKQAELKRLISVDIEKPLIVVTGGGLGAKRINDALVQIAPKLIKQATIVHICGHLQYKELRSVVPKTSSYRLISFVDNDMASLLGAADIVVSRAGATTLLELAALAKPVIIIPNTMLSGGHQSKNAKVYEQAGAALLVDEVQMHANADILYEAIYALLRDPRYRARLAKRLHAFARPNAAKDVAKLIIKAAGRAGEG